MSYSPGEDAEELRGVLRPFLAKHSPMTTVRQVMETDTGFEPVMWKRIAVEMGLQGVALPEIFDGGGATLVELGVIMEEMGRVLFPSPFLATAGLAATALLEVADEDHQREYLPRIASGGLIAALAWRGSIAATSIRAQMTDGHWTLLGNAPIVIDGATADLVLVAAQTVEGPALFAVDGNADGLERVPLSTLDQTRKLASLTFENVPARALSSPGDAAAGLARVQDIASLLLAAEQLGGATRVLEIAVEYATNRVQFGRVIGSFQAIKHRCADMLIDVESARSVVHHGLWAAVNDPASLPVAASLARSVASDVFSSVAGHNIQIHGGIGFSWEHDAHLYLKRAKSSQLLLGMPSKHRARLADLLGIQLHITSPEPLSEGRPTDAAADLLSSTGGEPALPEVAQFLSQHPVSTTDDRVLREERFDAGLAVVSFDVGYGGLGMEQSLQPAVEAAFADAGAAGWVERNVIGLGMALPTIHRHGTPEQRSRHLRPCFTGEEIWCQLFSEPGAGSDLAALACSAVRDGDDFVINGQKVWTSLGHVADFGLLLARTDPDVPKHKGLTYFILDMRTPGVDVRPLRQLTGEAEFNEVYLTNVRVPATSVLGEVGQGWAVAMTTLANERVSLGGRSIGRGEGPISQAVQVFNNAVRKGRTDAADRERLMGLWTRAEAARLTNVRAAALAGRDPGPAGSIAKLQMAELNQAIYEFCIDYSGDDALQFTSYAETAPATTSVHGTTDVRMAYLRSRANSIEGGTSEVLRNILGERVLGLPGEPRTDRDLPWREIRRS